MITDALTNQLSTQVPWIFFKWFRKRKGTLTFNYLHKPTVSNCSKEESNHYHHHYPLRFLLRCTLKVAASPSLHARHTHQYDWAPTSRCFNALPHKMRAGFDTHVIGKYGILAVCAITIYRVEFRTMQDSFR